MHRIREVRKKYSLSQEDLSSRVHLSRKCISNIETYKTSPTLVTLIKIAEALQVSIHDLLDEGHHYCQLRNDPLMECGHPRSALRYPDFSDKRMCTNYCMQCALEIEGMSDATMDRAFLAETSSEH